MIQDWEQRVEQQRIVALKLFVEEKASIKLSQQTKIENNDSGREFVKVVCAIKPNKNLKDQMQLVVLPVSKSSCNSRDRNAVGK